ncbi:hypothetical protein [Alicyclobacillus macrosporangiidus]|uniref:hypothetical protein n=1 Tax=Alicyclobacillus macrosporangiidus TaxID=392015 RepID=UPI00049630EB|nr:hypothetical protein [Alicyclobacillus macrosporangiidus]
MNWFASLIANLINALANGIQSLLDHTVAAQSNLTSNVMGNVILSGYFTDPKNAPVWGGGNFSDVMDAKAVQSLQPFAYTFWVFGWAFFAVSIYLLAMQVSGAVESSVQRERLKNGIMSLILTSLLMWQGEHLALLITQIFFYPSLYFLTLNPLPHWSAFNVSGDQALLNSIVNLFQALLAFIVWVVYEFRKVFLYVWMVFFPLAMAFYANDKTRPVAKMWWTEWIYQMAVPLGQAVVFGVSTAVAGPSGGSNVTTEDVFVALSGTIGLLASAVYVRKLVEMVAQGFGASMIGADHGMAWGSLAMAGTAAVAADIGGKVAVKSGAWTAKKTVGKVLHKADNRLFREKAEEAIKNYGEVHAGAIKAGASAEDIAMGNKLSTTGDVLQNGGVGLEAAAAGGTEIAGGGGMGRGGAGSGRSGRGGLVSVGRSRTASEIGATVQGVRRAFAGSHFGTYLSTRWKGFQNKGGVSGHVGEAVASATGKAAEGLKNTLGDKPLIGGVVTATANAASHLAQRHLVNRHNRTERLQALRAHMREIAEHNELVGRLPGISAMYDPEHKVFQGLTPAETTYNEASTRFIQALKNSGMSHEAAQQTLQQAQQLWEEGRHLPGQGRFSPEAQLAYRQAFTAYRPAQLDAKAKQAVSAGKLKLDPPKDPHKARVAKTNAFLSDARNAIMYKR